MEIVLPPATSGTDGQFTMIVSYFLKRNEILFVDFCFSLMAFSESSPIDVELIAVKR